MALVLYAPPADEPVDLAEAKAHLRVSTTDDDVYIQQLIVAARRWAEEFTRRSLVTQTWDLYLDGELYANFSRYMGRDDIIRMPFAPLQSVTHIKYIDIDGTEQTLSSSIYTVDNKSQPGRIALAYGQSWPSGRDVINSVNIRFIAGYGTPEDVPEDFAHAIKIMIAHLYEHREPIIVGAAISNVPDSAEALLWPYRVELP
jgi:uncharacterized phiE125 gp8 family phage protein